jgi:hypothetical protein
MPEVRHTLIHLGLVHPQVATVHDAMALELEARLMQGRYEERGKPVTDHDRLVFLQQAEILINARRRQRD